MWAERTGPRSLPNPMNAHPDTRPRDRFESRLSRLLLDRGLVTRDELTEALEQQLILGGHLTTNLWELGLMEAEDLDRICCELLGIPGVRVEDVLRAPPAVLRRFSRPLVERSRALPIRFVDRSLHIAACEPWNEDALKELAFATSLRLVPHYLAEVALMRLAARLYGLPLSARFRIGRTVPLRRRAEADTAGEPAEELMPEGFFESLYAKREAPAEGDPALQAEDEVILDLVEVVDDEVIDLEASDPVAVPPEVPATPPLMPIESLEEAGGALREATTRDDVGRVLVRFALGRGRRVVLLTRRGSLWFGWQGAGPGVEDAAVRGLMMPSEPGTAFGLVGQTGAPFLGPLAVHEVHDVFLDRIGKAKPGSVGLFPIHHRGRVVFGIYLDGGDGNDLIPDVGELILLAQRTAITLDRLLSERLSSRDPGGASTA
jgi:hypothetical protein